MVWAIGSPFWLLTEATLRFPKMAQELQALKVRVEQLQAENDHLRREWDATQAGPSSRRLFVNSIPEFVYLPHERRCPVFRGHHGVGIDEWIEEVQLSIRTRHLALNDQACFRYDHRQGNA